MTKHFPLKLETVSYMKGRGFIIKLMKLLLLYAIVSTHTHPYSGDRLWTDQKCPICRVKKIQNAEDRELQRKTDQEHDRMLLHLSLDIDKGIIQKRKVF